MRKLVDFNEFLFNQLLEKNMKVNELELIISPRMKNILKDMNHKIADDLLALHKDSKREYKRTFLDLGSEPDKISFIQSNKVPDLIEPEIVHGTFTRNRDFQLPPRLAGVPDTRTTNQQSLGDFEYVQSDEWSNPWIQDTYHVLDLHEIQFTDKNHPVWHKLRGEQSIGRFINQMFPGKYTLNVLRKNQKTKPEDVESFRDMFVALVEANAKVIAQVNGEDIRVYYNCKNYYKDAHTLYNSCMKFDEKMDQLDFYIDNPEVVSMLILYPEDIRDKIIGRALLWKLSKVDGKEVKDTYYMDRVYVSDSSDEYMFIEYAKNHGYYYKSIQTFGIKTEIVRPNGTQGKVELEVQVKAIDYEKKYPYLDSIPFYDPKTGHLTNKEEDWKKNGYGSLTDYMGPIVMYDPEVHEDQDQPQPVDLADDLDEPDTTDW